MACGLLFHMGIVLESLFSRHSVPKFQGMLSRVTTASVTETSVGIASEARAIITD